MIRIIVRYLPALAMACLAGCGGSSSNPGNAESAGVPALDGPLQGYIAIEERSGKRVFDGWFSRGKEVEQTGSVLWQQEGGRCVVSLSDTMAEVASATQVGTRWQDTLFAGEEIRIQSRAGNVMTLQAQRYENAVLYATAERWLAEALPDDAQLTITGSDQFPGFGPVALMPLTPLVSSQPAGGYSTDVTQPIVWESSADNTDDIELTVSVTTGDADVPSRNVTCALVDSGEFVLPDAVVQYLPQTPQLIYSLVRIRKSTHVVDGALLHITQLSYP